MVAPNEETKESSSSEYSACDADSSSPNKSTAPSNPRTLKDLCADGKCLTDDERNAEDPCVRAEQCVNSCASYGKVCPYVARIAAKNACLTIQRLGVDSKVFPQGETPSFVLVDPDDVVIGERLGHGGFSNVNQCVIVAGKDAGKECVIKYLRKQVMVDLHAFKHGAADLAGESYFLHTLKHKNIVRFIGMSSRPLETSLASGMECGFFILIERLFDTLDKRIERWKEEREKHGLLFRFSHDYKAKMKAELMDRVRTAYMIADALEYLHSLNIVYRDLKPDNVGFDKDGVLKLFDFGLAKELKHSDERLDGMYELTGNTGSRRYMAPEVGLDECYNKSVDAYSFGILLWEMCAAETPFHGYNSAKHMELVVMGGERPSMDASHTSSWPMNLQWLMNRCWSTTPADRPTFTAIKKVLLEVLECKESAVASPGAGAGPLPSLKPLSAKGRSKTWGFMKR